MLIMNMFDMFYIDKLNYLKPHFRGYFWYLLEHGG